MSLKSLQIKIGAIPDGDFGPNTMKKAMEYFKMTPERAAHFFAQTSHESGGFTIFSENLNYSKEGLLNIFKSDFDTNKDRKLSPTEIKVAEMLARKPEQIANFVYANQNGNGGVSSGDGWKFRGRGAIQLTGRSNYEAFSKHLNKPEIITNPDLVATEYSFESAMFFFDKNKLWSICDQGVNKSSILALTKKINGGVNGLDDREIKTYKYYQYVK